MDSVSATEAWVKSHERILIALFVLASIVFISGRWLDYKSKQADTVLSVATQQLNDQKQKDAQLQAQVSQLYGQYVVLSSQLQAKDAALAAAISNRTIVLQQAVATDKTLPLPELADRWAQLGGFSSSEINATDKGLTVSDTASRTTVATLEQVPVLTQNLADEKTIATNTQTQLNQANYLITGLNTQVSSLKVTITDDEKACTAKVNDVKAQASKSKVKWFKFGFVTGFISGVFVGHSV